MNKFLFLNLPQIEEIIVETFCGFVIIFCFGPFVKYNVIENPFVAYKHFFSVLINTLDLSSAFIIGIIAPSLGFAFKPIAMILGYYSCFPHGKLRMSYFSLKLMCKVHKLDFTLFSEWLNHIDKQFNFLRFPCFSHLGTKLHVAYRIWLLKNEKSSYWQWEHFLFRFYTRATGLTALNFILWVIEFFVVLFKKTYIFEAYVTFLISLLIFWILFAGCALFQRITFSIADAYMFRLFMEEEKEGINKIINSEFYKELERIFCKWEGLKKA